MQRIRFGVVGLGRWGRVHADIYSSHPHSELAAVCDLDQQRAGEFAARYGLRKVYSDYNKMMRDPEIDAVAVVTPDFAHCGPIVAAARMGKHVLVEKPLATTLKDLEEISEAVGKAGISFMVDFHCRWYPPIVIARQSIDKGELGAIISAYLRLNDTIFVPTRMLPWAGKSSILWFLGSHAVDALRYMLSDEVERVYALSRSEVLTKRGLNVPDIYQAILEFSKGTIASLECNWIVPNTNPGYNDFKVNILGSKGMINMDLTHNQLIERYLEDRSDRPDCLEALTIHGKRIGFAYESIMDFIECVTQGKPVRATLEDGVRTSKVLLAMLKSAEEMQPVKLSQMG
ncbi:MAG: Gfo/Idh/MocA family oxidoreductase [Terriglobia bacterium]